MGEELMKIEVDSTMCMPDNKHWTNRFEIYSETSDRVYVISQNIRGRFWGCSCPGWRAYRKCKHLTELGLPNYEQPKEVEVYRE